MRLGSTDLVLLEKTEMAALVELAAFPVDAPLDGVAH